MVLVVDVLKLAKPIKCPIQRTNINMKRAKLPGRHVESQRILRFSRVMCIRISELEC